MIDAHIVCVRLRLTHAAVSTRQTWGLLTGMHGCCVCDAVCILHHVMTIGSPYVSKAGMSVFAVYRACVCRLLLLWSGPLLPRCALCVYAAELAALARRESRL